MSISLKDKSRQVFEDILVNGQIQMERGLESILNEYNVRKNMYVSPEQINITVSDIAVNTNDVGVQLGDDLYNLTNFSKNQLFQRAGVPQNFAQRLIEAGQFDLLSQNLNKMTKYSLRDNKKLFIREVDGTIKGYLSDSYKPMDAAPILESFIKKCIDAGYKPYISKNTDYRYNITFLYDRLFELYEDEYIVYGISVTTSDYGMGAVDFEMFALRLWCRNGCYGHNLIQKKHIGKRNTFQNNNGVFSLDSSQMKMINNHHTAALNVEINSVVGNTKQFIPVFHNQIQDGAYDKINIDKASENYSKKYGKNFGEQVKDTYINNDDTESLPQREGAWRLSNTLSYLSKSFKGDKRHDIQKDAMKELVK